MAWTFAMKVINNGLVNNPFNTIGR